MARHLTIVGLQIVRIYPKGTDLSTHPAQHLTEPQSIYRQLLGGLLQEWL
jgi:hypothetical protein